MSQIAAVRPQFSAQCCRLHLSLIFVETAFVYLLNVPIPI